MGSVWSKKTSSDSKKSVPIPKVASAHADVRIEDEDILKERANALIQEINIIDGLRAEQDIDLEQNKESLNEALREGNAMAVTVLTKAVEKCNMALATTSQKRLQLETIFYEIQGDLMDVEDAKYSAKLCSAIDASQAINFPLIAVKFTWLLALESLLNIKYPEKPISEVTMSFLSSTYVRDETMGNGLSLCDHFLSEGEGKIVGLATHYIVYSQSMYLTDLLDSLTHYFERNGMSTTEKYEQIFVWLDVFSFTQDIIMLQSLKLNLHWYGQCLAPALTTIAKAIIVLDHRKSNPVLKSSWALLEIYLIGISSTIEVEITMSRANSKLFVEESSTKGTRRVFPQIAPLNLSTCSIAGKKEEITAALETFSSSESEFHESVKNLIDELMSNYLYALMSFFRDDSNFSYESLVSCVIGDFCQVRTRYDESEQSFKYSLKLARKIYGNLDPRTIRIVKKMIKFYEVTGAFDKAEDLRNFGKPNRDKGGGDMITLRGTDMQVVSGGGQS
jgi:hypothetical protein